MRLRALVSMVSTLAILGPAQLASAQLASAQPAPAEGASAPAVRDDRAPVVPYAVRFEGTDDEALLGLIDRASATLAAQGRPPPNELALRRRAEADQDNLVRAMRSLGYYRGTVTWRLEAAAKPGDPRPLVFTLQTGPQYTLRGLQIRADGAGPLPNLPTPAALGLRKGAPATAQSILSAEQDLVRRVRAQGYALAAVGPRSAVVEHETAAMDLVLVIVPGPIASFGEVRIAGNEGIDERYIRNRLPFREGERFDPALVDQARNDLVATELFASVALVPGSAVDAQGRLPSTLSVAPRPFRSIGGAVNFRSDEGASVSAFWENRNLWGSGERLRLDAEAGETLIGAGARYRQPDFLDPRLALILSTRAQIEETNAYDSRSLSVGAGIEQQLSRRATATYGVRWRFAEIDQAGERDTYGLLSFPTGLDWSNANDVLDPTAGGRLVLEGTPSLDLLGAGTEFVKLRATYMHYLRIARRPTVVLALRGSIGSIIGATTEGVPPDERFYSGGGGSVRGIPYQLAGPLDENGDPTGGLSILELNAEIRWRATESIGLVAFVDGGGAFGDVTPSWSEDDFRIGTGLGLRYYTAIGPIRADLAIPLQRRGVDDPFQIYVSIGQAF